jgi:hypothetical protein
LRRDIARGVRMRCLRRRVSVSRMGTNELRN